MTSSYNSCALIDVLFTIKLFVIKNKQQHKTTKTVLTEWNRFLHNDNVRLKQKSNCFLFIELVF